MWITWQISCRPFGIKDVRHASKVWCLPNVSLLFLIFQNKWLNRLIEDPKWKCINTRISQTCRVEHVCTEGRRQCHPEPAASGPSQTYSLTAGGLWSPGKTEFSGTSTPTCKVHREEERCEKGNASTGLYCLTDGFWLVIGPMKARN